MSPSTSSSVVSAAASLSVASERVRAVEHLDHYTLTKWLESVSSSLRNKVTVRDYDFEKAAMLNCVPVEEIVDSCAQSTLDFVILEGDQRSMSERKGGR